MNKYRVLEFWQTLFVSFIGGGLISLLPFNPVFEMILAGFFGYAVWYYLAKRDNDES